MAGPSGRSVDLSWGAHRLRTGRVSRAGGVYFVTCKARPRHPGASHAPISLVEPPGVAEALVRSIVWREAQAAWTWHCYVVMPDHVHVVFTMEAGGALDRLVGSFKRHTATVVNRILGRRGALWQDGYFDHRLRTGERLEWTAFYCLRNPVLAGLVARGDDWPWYGCKPGLRDRVRAQYDEFLSLESERKSWVLPPAAEV